MLLNFYELLSDFVFLISIFCFLVILVDSLLFVIVVKIPMPPLGH